MADHTLLGTTDGMMWAQEFCRIFKGFTIIDADYAADGGGVPAHYVDEGAMVTWFANAVEVGRSAARPQTVPKGTWHAFLHFYYLDQANAAIHTAEARYSPITFRLAEFIADQYPVVAHPEDHNLSNVFVTDDPRLRMVLDHVGAYAEDTGR